jgi:hypothetical protein
MPAVGLDLNFPPKENIQAQPKDNIEGEWDPLIVNAQPARQIQQDIQPEEQQISNHHSGLSSDNSISLNPGAPVQNG